MWQVARATSAAPTYFEPAAVRAFKDEGDHALVDGGVFANNPTVAAYSDALELWRPAAIYVVSLGTGAPPPTHPVQGGIPVEYANAQHWGLARWAHPLLEVVFDGIEKAVEYQMLRLAGPNASERYFRLQSPLPTASHAMDDASPENIIKLKADADTLVQKQSATMDTIVDVLRSVAADRDGAAGQ
jgi:predicted acylesterase/phospholipase RssA